MRTLVSRIVVFHMNEAGRVSICSSMSRDIVSMLSMLPNMGANRSR